MEQKLDSNMMKKAVEVLWNHELKRNNKVSSHSQLERWIVTELTKYVHTSVGLRQVMKDIRDIDFDIYTPIPANVPMTSVDVLKAWYGDHGFHHVSTGGASDGFQKTFEDDSSLLVTEQNGCNIPEKSTDSVSFGMYDENGNQIYHANFANSCELFDDKMFLVLSNSMPVQ